MSDRKAEIEKLKKNIAQAEKQIALGKQKSVEVRGEGGKVVRKTNFEQLKKGFEKKLKALEAPKKRKKLPPTPKAQAPQPAPQPAPARQPPPPQNTGSVNTAQIGIRSLSSITPSGGAGGGGGGGGGQYRGGGGGGGGGGPRARRQRVGGQPVKNPTAKPKAIKKPRKVKSAPAAPSMKQSNKQSTKPKRDITKITTPKPKSTPKQAIGTVAKRVGGGKKVKQAEQTKPIAKGRIRGENTAPRGKGPRATY